MEIESEIEIGIESESFPLAQSTLKHACQRFFSRRS